MMIPDSFTSSLYQLPTITGASRILLKDGESCAVRDEADFALLIDRCMGRDAAEYYVSSLSNATFDVDACEGECDHIYQMQEEYEDALKDVLYDLKQAVSKKSVDHDLIHEAMEKLENAIT